MKTEHLPLFLSHRQAHKHTSFSISLALTDIRAFTSLSLIFPLSLSLTAHVKHSAQHIPSATSLTLTHARATTQTQQMSSIMRRTSPAPNNYNSPAASPAYPMPQPTNYQTITSPSLQPQEMIPHAYRQQSEAIPYPSGMREEAGYGVVGEPMGYQLGPLPYHREPMGYHPQTFSPGAQARPFSPPPLDQGACVCVCVCACVHVCVFFVCLGARGGLPMSPRAHWIGPEQYEDVVYSPKRCCVLNTRKGNVLKTWYTRHNNSTIIQGCVYTTFSRYTTLCVSK